MATVPRVVPSLARSLLTVSSERLERVHLLLFKYRARPHRQANTLAGV